MHYAISRDLICHGFSVLSEKPFGATYLECMDLIACAKQHGVTVAAFHQSLYNPMFKKLKEIIAEGRLGNVYQVSMKYSGFARRWDWQTLQACCAGSVYNSGPHPIGQALDLLGWDPNTRVAFSSLQRVLTSGDSDDFGKIILSAPNKPVVDIEINSADAYAKDFVFRIFGSKGTLLSTNGDYKMKYTVSIGRWGAECHAGKISDDIWKYIQEECDGDSNEYAGKLDSGEVPDEFKLAEDSSSFCDAGSFFDAWAANADTNIQIYDEDENEVITRRKSVIVKPMSEEEAVLQMNMIGHDFFVYRSDTDNRICIVYRRKDGNYGLIETE
jgi:hypothetical protein